MPKFIRHCNVQGCKNNYTSCSSKYAKSKTMQNLIFHKAKKHNIFMEGVIYHTCNKCNQLFQKPANLKKHLSTCKGRTNYQCNICKKYYKNDDTLHAHQRIIHGINRRQNQQQNDNSDIDIINPEEMNEEENEEESVVEEESSEEDDEEVESSEEESSEEDDQQSDDQEDETPHEHKFQSVGTHAICVIGNCGFSVRLS